MSFLLDSDICSAYLKNDPIVVPRMMLHYGGCQVSVVTMGELLAWARRKNAPPARGPGVDALLNACTILIANEAIGERFGFVRAVSVSANWTC